ncbi:LANO_0E12288g1_1 [Lachancea nothofagi CBS 11611]|uniref:Chromatin modification-related protein EAF7 n=1 Tax=Lachancea nothofagi CBS 11611 TaxID=1266666 RepID=A0A1G4JY10_9SACH|nr:LANO_0E12288g1_1 [Lachancea nothofagi CBS 11611]
MTEPWSIEDDIRLFRWITDFKPAGLHKHFHMISILGRMNKPDQFPVVLLFDKLKSEGKGHFTADEIWTKLAQHYDLKKLDERENDTNNEDEQKIEDSEEDEEEHRDPSAFQALRRVFKQPQEFHLPWEEYGELILENARTEENQEDEEQKSDDDLDDKTSQDDTLYAERMSRRFTRSTASTKPQGRVTRSQGPAQLPRGVDKAQETPGDDESLEPSNNGLSQSEEPEEVELIADSNNGLENENPTTSDREDGATVDDAPMSQKDAVEDMEDEPEELVSEPSVLSDQRDPQTHGSPPSKRTRTTRSHPADSTTETADSVKTLEDSSAPTQPQGQAIVRSSSRVANRRKTRK